MSASVLALLFIVGGLFTFLSGSNSDKKASSKSTKTQSEVIVYETPVDSSEDCSTYEDFDEEASTCYFECEDKIEGEDISWAIDKELATLLDDYENGS